MTCRKNWSWILFLVYRPLYFSYVRPALEQYHAQFDFRLLLESPLLTWLFVMQHIWINIRKLCGIATLFNSFIDISVTKSFRILYVNVLRSTDAFLECLCGSSWLSFYLSHPNSISIL